MNAQAIFHMAPHTVEVLETEIPDPAPGELRIDPLCSALSPGTESLIFAGGMHRQWIQDETLGGLQGDFRYPFKYGYAMVGRVVAAGSSGDQDWIGRKVFAFHPHQSEAVVDRRDCFPLPESMPPERALFLANLETALGLVMDAAPLVGERAMIFGQGIVGLLVTAILSQFPLAELIAADPQPDRRQRALNLGVGLAIDPARGRELAVLEECLFHGGHDGLDFAIEVSGRTEALNQAISLCGFDGRIVIGSWYGRSGGPIDLGGSFHRRRLRLISSQVSRLDPRLHGRWSKQRRWQLALEWLDRIQPEQWITHRFRLADCQQAFELAEDPRRGALQIIFEYR